MLRKRTVVVYSNTKDPKYSPDEWKVTYENPKYFARVLKSVEFVDTDITHILAAYEAAGIPLSPLVSSVTESVPEESLEDQVITHQAHIEDEVVVEAEEVVSTDLDDGTKDPSEMAWATLKKYTKEATGKTPKSKKEALEFLSQAE